MLKTVLRRSTYAVPICPQKANGSSCSSQQWHPCRRVCDCPSNSCRPGIFKFLEEDHINYCTTVRGPDVLCSVIFSVCVTFYQINMFFVNIIFFHYWKNAFCGRVKWLRRLDFSADHSVENPDIYYEEEWWQHAPLSESNTNAEWLWFNSVGRGTIFWAGTQLLDGQQEAPVNTVLPKHCPKLFTSNPAIFPRSTKHVYKSLPCSQDFLKICWRVEIYPVVLRPRRKPYHPDLVKLQCCNLSGGVELNVWFSTNGMRVKNNNIHICGANKQ